MYCLNKIVKISYQINKTYKYMEGESYVVCKHCAKPIIQANYLIHEARCLLMSSRVSIQQKPKIYNQTKQACESPKVDIEPTRSAVSGKKRQRIFNHPRREQEQRIPCTFCGYMQTLEQLDTHPSTCLHKEEECSICQQPYPLSLMADHRLVCRERQSTSHIQQESTNPFEEYSDEEEGNTRFSPFGNLRFLFGSGRRSEIGNSFRNERQINGRAIVQESDGRGYTRRVIYGRNPNQDQIQPEFANLNANQLFLNNTSPFGQFFRLLQALAGKEPQSQGLNKLQIKKLQKIKYKKQKQSKEEEKDLCTICYCQFEELELIIKLKCKHIYHQQCIVKWLEKNAKCPVCKAPQTQRPIFNQE